MTTKREDLEAAGKLLLALAESHIVCPHRARYIAGLAGRIAGYAVEVETVKSNPEPTFSHSKQ